MQCSFNVCDAQDLVVLNLHRLLYLYWSCCMILCIILLLWAMHTNNRNSWVRRMTTTDGDPLWGLINSCGISILHHELIWDKTMGCHNTFVTKMNELWFSIVEVITTKNLFNHKEVINLGYMYTEKKFNHNWLYKKQNYLGSSKKKQYANQFSGQIGQVSYNMYAGTLLWSEK